MKPNLDWVRLPWQPSGQPWQMCYDYVASFYHILTSCDDLEIWQNIRINYWVWFDSTALYEGDGKSWVAGPFCSSGRQDMRLWIKELYLLLQPNWGHKGKIFLFYSQSWHRSELKSSRLKSFPTFTDPGISQGSILPWPPWVLMGNSFSLPTWELIHLYSTFNHMKKMSRFSFIKNGVEPI